MSATTINGLLSSYETDLEKAQAVLSGRKVLLSDLWIQTKEETFVPFTPNAVQESYLDELCPAWRDGDYSFSAGREIILKARQFGFSTLILALFFLNTVNNSDVNTVVIADKAENTAVLFEKVRLFYEYLPAELKPKKRYSNKTELAFADLRSTFRVLTAGSADVGRSKTIHNLHCSEVAFWPKEEVFTGLLQTVPTTGNIFIESTANGEGNDYHAEFVKAEKKQSPYTARFYAWYEHAEYRRTPPEGWIPRHDTMVLWARLPFLTDDQAYWWEQKRSEPGMGNLIGQEYPNNSKDAFRVSGTTFFTEWDEEKHVIPPRRVPYNVTFVAGLDWGFGKPWAFGLSYLDWFGGMTMVEEIWGTRVLNKDQAKAIVECLAAWEIPKEECEIYADPSMWNTKTQEDGSTYRDVDAFIEAGLVLIPANNRRTAAARGTTGSAGWGACRDRLGAMVTDRQTGETYPAFRVFDTCEKFIETIPQMKHSKTNPEDMESDPNKVWDHFADLWRYKCAAHLITPKTPAGQLRDRVAGFSSGTVDTATGKREKTTVERVWVSGSHEDRGIRQPWQESESGEIVAAGSKGGREWTY